MLKETLDIINKSSLYSDSLISERLNVTKDMANALVQDLIRMGYLLEEMGSPSCETSCNRCPYARSCNSTPVKTFKLSPKGESLLESM